MPALDALPAGVGVLLAGVVGLILGSFIATLVLRWPAGRSVLGRSQCDGCGRQLGAADLVPLLSALASRGRCRQCNRSIDPFHWRVELGAGLIGMVALTLMPGTAGWLWALFGWMLLPLALLDARPLWLPDGLNSLLGVTGLVIAGPMLATSLLDRWVGAVICGLTLAALAAFYRKVRLKDGMGGGDPKLVAAIGAWIGWQALPLMLVLASLGGILWALATQRKRDQPLAERPVPFGLFACVAAWAAVPIWLWISSR
ncbi:MAG: prepilin peptidase [Sphingopyxis sp.]